MTLLHMGRLGQRMLCSWGDVLAGFIAPPSHDAEKIASWRLVDSKVG